MPKRALTASPSPALPKITPVRFVERTAALDNPDCIFELKYDGFRAVAIWCQGDARFVPTFTEEPDGTIRFDLCARCAGDSPGLLACSQRPVDALH